jgi:3',5'-cyclic AMP phosphodiesterase CpdA
MPEVKNAEIPIPAGIENRFLPNGSQTAPDIGSYTDRIDPRNDAIDEVAAAVAGLAAIWRRKGIPNTPPLDIMSGAQAYDATVKCEMDGAETACRILIIDNVQLPEEPVVAHVKTGTGVLISGVLSCAGVSPKTAPPLTAPVENNPCHGTSLGTRVILDQSIPDAPLPPATVKVAFAPKLALSRSFLTFVHMSDTQLRDVDVKLGNEELSHRLDHLIESFEHETDQEQYGEYLVEALVATINREVAIHKAAGRPADAPLLVMHTGDSIDAGTKRELHRFHSIMDRLSVPWFNILGNHDVLVFGNFLPTGSSKDDKRCVSQSSVIAPYWKGAKQRWLLPGRICVSDTIRGSNDPLDVLVAGATHAESRANFIREHAHPSHSRMRAIPFKSTPSPGERCQRADVLLRGAHDGQHGFDLYPHQEGEPLRGYYAFAVGIDDLGDGNGDRRAIFIALNTEDLEADEGGNSGRLGEAQLAWLRRALACAGPHDLVFMFGHHQLSQIKIKIPGSRSRDAVLRDSDLLDTPNLVAYFYGHTHMHGLCRDRGACTKFWELESGSLIEHPQEARLARFKSIGAGLAFIETVTFAEQLADPSNEFGQRARLARRGADRDHCLLPNMRCSDDHRVRRIDGGFTHARLFFKLP